MQLPLKVMLVDDEIMALNNLKKLINWEEEGFKIAASETNPRRALESFKKLKPRIVLVDIKMPVMNGLELSREILALDIPVRIVILTSYKDFHYAKRAIEVGISNYLVKHELNEKTLLSELNRLREELAEDEKKEEIIRLRQLRSLLDNTISREVLVKKIFNRFIDFEIGKILFLFFKLDTPYKLYEDFGLKQKRDFKSLTDVIKKAKLGTAMDIFGLGSIETAVAVYLESGITPGEIDKIVAKLFEQVQVQLDPFNETTSVCPVAVKNDVNKIAGIYVSVKRVFEYSVFLGRGRILSPDLLTELEEIKNNFDEDGLNQLEKLLSEFDGGGVELYLDTVFTEIGKTPWDPVLAHKVCAKLTEILNNFLLKNYLPVLKDLVLEEVLQSNPGELYDLNEVRLLFKEVFSYSIEKAVGKKERKYSHKVEQALDYIHKHYMEDWAIEDVANTLNISEVYLRKIFKSETGSTIVNYLTELRMEKAIRLLKTEEYKIFEIAEKVGYNTSQYFSRAFRKYTGKSPGDYYRGINEK